MACQTVEPDFAIIDEVDMPVLAFSDSHEEKLLHKFDSFGSTAEDSDSTTINSVKKITSILGSFLCVLQCSGSGG